METIRNLNQQYNVSSLSMVHLHTQLPLHDLDMQLSEFVQSLMRKKGEMPILVFVGIQGNRGYAIDSIPVWF